MKYNYKLLRRFIAQAHKSQKRKYDNSPYSGHLLAVEKNAVRLAKEWSDRYTVPLPIIRAVALFHDYMEDYFYTNGTWNKLNDILIKAGYSKEESALVIHFVAILTKEEEHFNLINYLSRVKTSSVTLIVKLADLVHNMSDLQQHNLKKYNEYFLIKHYLLN